MQMESCDTANDNGCGVASLVVENFLLVNEFTFHCNSGIFQSRNPRSIGTIVEELQTGMNGFVHLKGQCCRTFVGLLQVVRRYDVVDPFSAFFNVELSVFFAVRSRNGQSVCYNNRVMATQ